MNLSAYMTPILSACLLFIPVAALFTLPFMIYQYRRYGSIPVLRVLIIYSFILYMMCAFLLTVLPLPDYADVLRMPAKRIQYIPFSSYVAALRKAGMSFSRPHAFFDPQVWLRLLRSGGFFEIFANIVMQVPLGIYLRYYFRRSWKQTLLIGFCVTLFYELTQLSGLFFIYPKAYRLCSVDDLIDNTLGCMIGYWITPLFQKILPTREVLDEIAVSHERKVTVMRRVTAGIVDWMIYTAVFLLPVLLHGSTAHSFLTIECAFYLLWVYGYFVFFQYYFHGKTIGKALVRIRVIDSEKIRSPKLTQFLLRYTIIYIAAPISMLFFLFAAIALITAIESSYEVLNFLGITGMFVLITASAWAVLHYLHRHNTLPHSLLSRTRIMKTARSDRAEAIYRRAREMGRKLKIRYRKK